MKPALALTTKRGKTFVEDAVISTIARIVAEQVEGIHHVGGTGLRGAFQRIASGGVDAEVGMKEAAVALDIVIEYGARIRDVTADLRRRVVEAVEMMADRKIVAVDINVVGVHITSTEPTPTHSLA